MHETYMQRCIDLAIQGIGHVAPNPMVGAVLVHENIIIGEGYHEQYGKSHAEVNCIDRVLSQHKHLIPASTLYVSLEPCSHFGKTPPCSDRIIKEKIKKVVIGCRDPFKEVDGKGIEKLKTAGVEVITDILQDACLQLNKRFFTFHTKHRPYIILKWAQTADKKISSGINERLLITNDLTNKIVHRWRSEEAAILVGTNTALQDNPSLNNRFWKGLQPIRLIIDKNLQLPTNLNIFDETQPTIVFNSIKQEKIENLIFQLIDSKEDILTQLLNNCHQQNIQSILVEGGAKLLQSFINANLWDEARVITNNALSIREGLDAPQLSNVKLFQEEKILDDTIRHYLPAS